MIVELAEMKQYLRVDYSDDDAIIEKLILSAERLCKDVLRLEEAPDLNIFKVAVMYAVAYLYEHREDADHHALNLTLRALLSGSRREAF